MLYKLAQTNPYIFLEKIFLKETFLVCFIVTINFQQRESQQSKNIYLKREVNNKYKWSSSGTLPCI